MLQYTELNYVRLLVNYVDSSGVKSVVQFISGLDTLHARRENITRDLFREIEDENHIHHSLLPEREITSMAVRNSFPYEIPITKVSRYGRGFLPYCIAKRF